MGTAWLAAVRVDAGGPTDLGIVTLRPDTGIIFGRVVTTEGAAVPSAVVTLRLPWDNEVGGNVVAGADGAFLARDLPCGVWRVQAASEGSGKSGFVVVTVDGSEEREIELVLAPPARVRVRLARDGAPVAGHELSLGRGRDGRVELDKFAVTDPNGEATFEFVSPGRVVVFAPSLGGRSLEVSPGDDILVELELGGEVVEVELAWRGAPLERISWCGLLDVDPRSATHGELHYGETLADGRVRLQTFAGASLLLANSKSFEPAATLALLVEGSRIPPYVAFSERALELEFETIAARRHAPAPRLVLTGVVGGAQDLPWPHAIVLPVERTLDGATRWPSVPAGVRLDLVGTDATGAEMVRAIDPQSASGRVRWR